MSHLPSTSSSGPSFASLLSSPSSSVLYNQMDLDGLTDQGNSSPQPSQETKVETNVKAYGCGVMGCDGSYSSPSGLYYHCKAAHPTVNPFRCALAGSKKYKNITVMDLHIIQVTLFKHKLKSKSYRLPLISLVKFTKSDNLFLKNKKHFYF